MLYFGGVGGEQLVEEAADELIDAGFQIRNERPLLIPKLIVLQMN